MQRGAQARERERERVVVVSFRKGQVEMIVVVVECELMCFLFGWNGRGDALAAELQPLAIECMVVLW